MTRKRRCCIVVLIIYVLALICILFLKNFGNTYPYTYTEYIKSMVNIVPFKSIHVLMANAVINTDMILETIIYLIGNIILFIPWGLFSVTFNVFGKFKKYFLYTLSCVLVIEAIQLFAMLGIFDIDDIIFNLSGALLGYWVVKKIWH